MVKYVGMGEANLGEETGDCSINKWTLIFSNVLMLLMGVIIIIVAAVAKAASMVCTMPILSGVIAMGVFLTLLAVMGLCASVGYPAAKRPILLNIYIISMLLLFLIHFSVSVAALTVNDSYQRRMMKEGWCGLDPGDQASIQKRFDCKGFDGNQTSPCDYMANVADYPNGTLAENPNCYDFLLDDINWGLEMAGAVSLVFCFVELVGVVLAVLYRRKSLVLWAQEHGYTKEIL